ncbi:MAG TPA: response regulator [candidate division Zixibacteria bacterium]|nr:response regulator [candidate division Zixibacteria bacterium]
MSDQIKLLIVDDEEEFLESIAKRLQMRDFIVRTASRGADAIELARREKFDLALLDLKMPGMDGKQVLEILKKEHKYLEVIILTGHGSVDSAIDCTKLGAFGYLPKPYELEKLLDTLRTAYQVRLERKFKDDEERIQRISQLATGSSALAILRELKKMDDEEK